MDPNAENPDGPTSEPLATTLGRTAQEPPPPPAVLDLQTRFLYPFFFEPNAVNRASDALTASMSVGIKGAWARAKPLAFYKEEVLEQVVDFLFSAGDTSGCVYLNVSGDATQAWFQRTEVKLSTGVKLPIRFDSGPRIELFLSSDGVGVLSVALTPNLPTLSLSAALDFNYQLAQCQPWSVQQIEVPGPDLSRVPPQERDKVRQIQTHDSPLVDRMTRRGGKFTLVELIDALLAPLVADPTFRFRSVQTMLSAYTVALVGAEVDMGLAEVRVQFAPFLSSLAQLEEPNHAGATSVESANAILNRRHWVAVGQLGTAHLIANQPPPEGMADHPYNPSRLARVRDKYFIPYLMGLLQRLVLHRSVETASTILKSVGRRRSRDLAQLRQNLLRFAIDGHFNRVSSRESLHRYYRVVQQGLDAPAAWEEIRLAIAELHAWEMQVRQRRLARNVSRNVLHIKEVQEFVHMIEYCLVSVYLAHLWHMFAEGNEQVERWVRLHLYIQERWVVSAGVVVFAVAGLLLVLILNALLKYLERRKSRRKASIARAKATTLVQ